MPSPCSTAAGDSVFGAGGLLGAWRLGIATGLRARSLAHIHVPRIEPILLTHVYNAVSRTLRAARVSRECCMYENEDRTVRTAVEARGARLGRPVLVVLIVSTLAVIGIFSLLYYGSFG
jgi:hypothetical protein